MTKILLLYFSGSGSTKVISEIITEKLSAFESIELQTAEIRKDFDYDILGNYDLYVVGFPTFGFKPPERVMQFLDNIPSFHAAKKAYAFATYALYQENCLRAFISKAEEKGIYVNNYTGFRGPASDGALFFPESWKFVLNYEKNISKHINKTVEDIITITKNDNNTVKKPAYKWYAPLNQLFVPMLEKSYSDIKKKMTIITDRCINCNYCVDNCPNLCLSKGDKTPSINHDECILCLRCVHNCPKSAIWLSDSMKDRKRLNNKFYKQKKGEILNANSN
ncbi:MAG: EFR1 family ferrodoxin [Vampirovibrionia bacterium]